MGHNLRPLERDQQYLMPPSLLDWLPADHLARVVIEAVASVDLSGFLDRYRTDGRGAAAYDPAMMVALLLYAYSTGEYSSRGIERRCHEDVAYRVICANATPDHATIARFRATNGPALEGLFGGVLRLCARAGMGRVGLVALDGTRLVADASPASVRTADALDAAIAAMLDRAAATDAAEDARHGPDRRGDELPGDLADPAARLARFAEARRQLAAEDAAREADVAAALERRAARELAGDRQGRGGHGPRVDAVRRRTWDGRSTTDPDARKMRSGGGGYVLGYNAQAVVSEDGLVLAHALTQQANDAPHLPDLLGAARRSARRAGMGRVGALVADAGYWSEANAAHDRPWGTRVLIRPNPGHRRPDGTHAPPRPARARMGRRLAHHRNTARMRRRDGIVEPVFGQVKRNRGFRRFSRRGRDACADEWALVCTAHNLRKLWLERLRRARPPRPPRPRSRPTTPRGAHQMPLMGG